jgi:hypothetical protein
MPQLWATAPQNDTRDDGGYYVEVNGGKYTGNTISAGYGNCAIYHPNSGTVIINNGTIKGTSGAGVVVRGGNLTVNGGIISGNGTGGDNVKMGDATATYCGGIEVGYTTSTGTDYPGGIGAISITGGYISSRNSDAVKVMGTAAGSTHSKASTITVTGGYFSSDPSAYIPTDGSVVCSSVKNETYSNIYGYKVGAPVASIGDNKYCTVQSAIDAVPSGNTKPAVINISAPVDSDGNRTILERVYVPAGKMINLVFENNTLLCSASATDVAAGSIDGANVKNDGNLTISGDGNLTCGSYAVYNTGEVILDSPAESGVTMYYYGTTNAIENKNGTANSFVIKDGCYDAQTFAAIGTKGISLQGGFYCSDPSEFVADGYKAITTNESDYYSFQVVPRKDGEAESATLKPVVVTSAQNNRAATSAANTIESGITTSTGLAAVGSTAAQNISDSAQENYKNASNMTGGTVYVETYLNISVTDATEGSGSDPGTLTLDIKPMQQTVVSTAKTAAELNNDGVNTNVVEQPHEVTINTPVTIKLPIPAAMAVRNSNSNGGFLPLTIKHVKENNAGTYYYNAEVTSETVGGSTAYYATFTITHGFSEFILTAENSRKVVIEYKDYPSIGYTYWDLYRATDVGIDLLTPDSRTGYSFTGWSFEGVSGTYTRFTSELWDALTAGLDNGNSKNVTATPVFTSVPVSTGTAAKSFTITAKAGDNGAIAPNGAASVASGKDQTYTITPNKGYEVADVLVDGKSVGAVKTYTFSAVTADHTISVTFKTAAWVNPFADVAENDWFYSYVQYANENGLFAGLTPTAFGPGATMTRGMLVTVLYGMAGKPAVTAAASFSDVKAGDYYANAVAWASANKIVSGYSNGKFGPNDPVTREQLATILYAYAAAKGYDTTQGGMAVREFSDYGSISNYALTAMQWAVNAGILQGANGKLLPGSNATRAQVAAMLTSFCKNVAK